MLAETNKEQLRVGGVDILLLDAVRDLGVVLDSNLTIKKHVDGIVRSHFYQQRQLRSVCRSLTFNAAHVLVHVFIHSPADYCNTSASAMGLSESCHQYCMLQPVW